MLLLDTGLSFFYIHIKGWLAWGGMSTALTVTFIIYYELFAKPDTGLSFFYISLPSLPQKMQSGKKFLSVASVRESINTRTDAIDIHTFCPVFGTVGTQTGEFLYRRSCLMAGRGWHVNGVNSYFYSRCSDGGDEALNAKCWDSMRY